MSLTKQQMTQVLQTFANKGIQDEHLRLCAHVIQGISDNDLEQRLIFDSGILTKDSTEILDDITKIYTALVRGGQIDEYIPSSNQPPPPPGSLRGSVGASYLTELKADIAPKANQGSFEAEYNKYKKHFDDFFAYFEKQSKTDFYSSRPREDLKFYTIDDSGYKQDLAAKIFAQQIDEVNLNREDSIDFIKKHFMSTIIGSNDMDDFSHIYNTYEKILQETELGYTPVQMLLDLSDNFISKYKEQYLKVLDKAIEDNTFSVNGPSEPYITVENLPDILDKLIAYKHNRGIELLFKSENFARLLFDQDSQAEVKTVLKTRISNGTLRKALGDSFEQTIIDVAEEFNDKNKETILKALSNKKDRNNDRDDDRSSNRRRDESKEEVPESTNFFENTESASSKEFSLISDTSKTTVGVGTVTIIAFAILTALAAVGTGGTALIAAAVLAPVVGGIATFASVKNDKVEFQAEQLNKATNKIHSAYQDRGQHPADSRKGPPYAERAENGRSADRSKGGYSR